MARLKTVSEIAAPLAKVTHQERGPVERQIRGWVQQGILIPTQTEKRGTTGSIEASLFNETEMCRARLLMALSQASNVKFSQAVTHEDSTYIYHHRNIEAAVSGTKTGENWYFRVVVSKIQGELRASCQWTNGHTLDWQQIEEGDTTRIEPSTSNPLHPDVNPIGGTVEAVIMVPFSKLIRPLLATAEA